MMIRFSNQPRLPRVCPHNIDFVLLILFPGAAGQNRRCGAVATDFWVTEEG